MMIPYVTSIQVGLPKTLGVEGASKPMNRPWTTGFLKKPVYDKIWVGSTNLTGDGQADLEHHGGSEKAVLAYSAEHYPAWREKLQIPDFSYGAFGENLTIVGQTEDSVCIGDIYELGEAKIQVSQPRQPCWRLSRRWQIRNLALQVQKIGLTGWYFRVLKEGYIEVNLPLILRERFYPQWTIQRANRIMHHEINNREDAAKLAACPLLALNWQKTLSLRANKAFSLDPTFRLWGNN